MTRKMRIALILMCAAFVAAEHEKPPETLVFPEPIAREYKDSLAESEKLQAIKAAIEARITVEEERQRRLIYQAALQLGLTQRQVEKAVIQQEGGPKFVISEEEKVKKQ